MPTIGCHTVILTVDWKERGIKCDFIRDSKDVKEQREN